MAQKRSNNWVQDYFFLIIPKPLEDELLSSWLTRMAFEHQRTLTTFLSLFIKQDGSSLSRKDIDFLYEEKLFDSLFVKSNLSKKEILKMSLRSEEGYLYSCNNCLYPPNQIRKLVDKRTHHGLMYCPKCLAEDEIPYFRKKWRYTFYNACPKHKIFLTDRCWACYERINFSKIKHTKSLAFCNKCEKDLRTSIIPPIQSNYNYGLRAIKWFEKGFDRGYFFINKQKVHSLFVFDSFTRFTFLLDRKDNLILENFPLITEYKSLCKKLENYSSKKASMIYKDFFLTAMVYFLFQDYPKKFISFAKENHLTYRDFSHGFMDSSFWYRQLIDELIPRENKIGREISESEVIGAIKYLKSQGKSVNQLNVAEVIGCHFTIHKGFIEIYHGLKNKITYL